jgi:hypothetical protein
MRLDDIDLTDLDRFVDGFPHDVLAHLRREAPVWFHPPTPHTPGGEGFGREHVRRVPRRRRRRGHVQLGDRPRAGRRRGDAHRGPARRIRVRGAAQHDGRPPPPVIAAGSESTRNSLTLGVLALGEHPDQWRALADDRTLLPGAADEILRWASTTPYNRRTATVDTVLGGQRIAAGDKVTLWWASANHDEAVFADPFTFDVRRDPNPHLACGHGSHFCLGSNLARTEIRLVLDALLDRFAAIRPAGPLERTRSNKHTGVRHAPVALVPW